MSEMVLLVMLALNGGQGDLLSMVPTDSYWHEQKIAVAADQMIPLITTKGAPDISDLAKKLGSDKQQEREDAQKQIVAMGPAVLPQVQALLKSSDAEVVTRAQAIIKELSASPAGLQRLMAIRTLGELKSKEALDELGKLKDSKEPFVAQYAQTAIDRINGKEPKRAKIDPKLMQEDLYLLPANCGIVAQATMGIGEMETLAKASESVEVPEGMSKEKVINAAVSDLVKMAAMVGNIRLDGITVGVSEEVSETNGFVILIARGHYDSKRVRQLLLDQTTHVYSNGVESIADRQPVVVAKDIDGIEVLTGIHHIIDVPSFIMPSDDRLVLMFWPKAEKVPVKEMAAAIKAGKGTLADNPDMAKLIKSVDTTQGLWAVAKMTDAYKAVDFFAPFKTMTLVASTKDNVTKATIVAQGDDADKVKAAKETLEGLLKETKAAMGTVESYKKAYVQPVVEGIDSIKIELDGAKATATGELKGFSAMRFFLSQSAEMMHMQEETQKRAQESKDRIMREDRIMRAVPPS